MKNTISSLIGAAFALSAMAQTAREIKGPAPVIPLANEPAPKIVIDPPLPQALARGLVVIQYRGENVHIVPVFGAAALEVSPRLGHLHVTVDDASWHWVDASAEPLIIQGLLPGSHKVLIELADANHKILDKGVVSFVIPTPAGR